MTKEQMQTAFDDIKQAKNYILGLIAFATGVGTFLVQVLHFKAEPTILVVAGFAILILLIGGLIHNSEKRQSKALQTHIDNSNDEIAKIGTSLDYLKGMAIETQRSTIRIEMNDIMRRYPENHDTILAYAEKYFVELEGDWKETDIFFAWIESENEKGHTVHIPPQLKENIYYKREIEKGN